MKWDLPPKIKIYEALGSIIDGRVEVIGDEGKVFSSTGNKFYQVQYDPKTGSIMSNDNASYFVGYLGYPAIAFLMKKGVITYNRNWEEAMKGIPWKDINQKFKNDFKKTKEHSLSLAATRGFNKKELIKEVDAIYEQIVSLELNLFGKKKKPPKGY